MKTLLLSLLFILSLEAKERVVSLSPSITEIIYALNAGESIVATSSYSLYPPEAQELPVVGGYTNPSIEKIIAQRPSLVVGQSFNADTLKKLNYFHIQTLQLKLLTLQNIKDSIQILGTKLKHQEEATQLTNKIKKSIKAIKKVEQSHSVLIVYGLKEDLRSGIYIAGHNIFFEDIIKLSGHTNAYTQKSTSQPVLNYENIIAINPDQIIILHSHATEPNVDVEKSLQNWYHLPINAAKNAKISIVDEDYLHIPSHRVALTIERLSKEMHD